jgi:hypothetical protein
LVGLGLIQVKNEYDSYFWTTPDGERWVSWTLSRNDPFLAQVVEELGKEAGNSSCLMIREIPEGTKYTIVEYNGMETVMTIDEHKWSVA